MNNNEIARIFELMSIYIEMSSNEKNSFFKSRALKNAAEVVTKLDFELDLESVKGRDLTKIKGIGKSTSEHIIEYLNTGKVEDYEKLKKENPVDLENLLKIQFLGPKKIKKLYEQLGTKTVEELKEAAENGLISQLEGFGKKSEEKILTNIENMIVNKDKVLYSVAINEFKKLKDHILKNDQYIKNIEPAGSLRRKKEVVGDIDILIATTNTEQTIKQITKYKGIKEILNKGDTKISLWLNTNLQCDIRIVDEKFFGSALQYFTGNVEHNVKLRNIAISMNYKLSEYGLVNRETENIIESNSEEKLYGKLGLQYVKPELREDMGEIELAKANNLPNIITKKDIKGDHHTHTTFSDGKNTPQEMIEHAIKLGYNYICITDHIGNLPIANAINTTDRFNEYLDTVQKLKEKYSSKIEVYVGGEVEVEKYGALGFDEKSLSKLDLVIAGTHLHNNQNYKASTDRLINVLNNPLVKILAHPTGRLLLKREGIEFDLLKISEIATKNNVALEINSQPDRLDLDWRKVKLAKNSGVKFAINTDAHSITQMSYIENGINIARKGWLTKNDLWSI